MATTSSTASPSNAIQALGAGSGLDVKALAQSLADAEMAPQKDRVNAVIAKTEARISGYGALNYALSQLRGAFERLNDASDFGSPRVVNSQDTALGVVAGSTAKTGSHSVEVLQLAKPQRSQSNGFATPTASLNGGQPFSLNLVVGGGPAASIAVSDPTPEGVAAAINQSGRGLSAQLLNTGVGANPHVLVVTGEEGAAKAFTLTSSAAGVDFAQSLGAASDAQLRVNGLTVHRPSNTITDLLADVTFKLYGTTSGAARVDLSRDVQLARDNIKALVQAYNDFEQSLKILGDSKSEVETLGGSLAGDTLLRTVRNELRNLMVSTSSTPGSRITAARDLGLSFDRNGRLSLDEAKLDRAMQANYDEVAKVFSAGTNNKSLFSNQPAGLAGDSVARIDRLLRSTGLLAQQTESATRDLNKYKARLKVLDTKLERILERYTEQFSVMESVVGNTNSLKNNLKSSFEGMMAAYTR